MSDKLKDACAYIEVAGTFGKRRGTGYLVRPDRVATCEYVVRGATEGTRLVLRFQSGERQATVEKLDAENDCAILRLELPMASAPLPLGAACPKDAPFVTYGFPQASAQGGQFLDGKVQDPQGKDRQRNPALVLSAPSAPRGAPLKGYSGSPILIDGQVVGHLKPGIPDADGGSTVGTLHDCPIRFVETLLPAGYTPAQARRPPQAARASYDPYWYISRPS